MDEIVFNVAALAVGLALTAIIHVVQKRQLEAQWQDVASDMDSALPTDASLELDALLRSPELRGRLDGRVKGIYLLRHVASSAGGEAGEDFSVNYSACLVDVHDVPHDLVARGEDWGELGTKLEALAGMLDVRYEDTSYGSF